MEDYPFFTYYHTHFLPSSFTHEHDGYEIMYSVRGEFAFHYYTDYGVAVDGIIREPHSLIFIPNHMRHGVKLLQYPYDRYFTQIPANLLETFLSETNYMNAFYGHEKGTDTHPESRVPRFLYVNEISGYVESVFRELYDASLMNHARPNSAVFNMKCLLGCLFSAVDRYDPGFFNSSLSPETQSVAISAKNYIDEHYSQPMTINELAAMYNLHPNYFSTIFRRQIGLSPRQYLTNLRLQKACRLLQSSQLTVQETAAQVGYSDINNFIKNYRQLFGCTPKQYRTGFLSETSV